MVPRIISQIGTNLTLEMPLPNSIAEEKFNLTSWALCYDENSVPRHFLLEAAKYNAKLLDIKILWIKGNFYFELYFENVFNFENFKNVICTCLSEKL